VNQETASAAHEVRAIVDKVYPEGPHGPYARAKSSQLDKPITFSLESEVWKENAWPEQGTVVVLSDLREKRAGLRAHCARFSRPVVKNPEGTNNNLSQ